MSDININVNKYRYDDMRENWALFYKDSMTQDLTRLEL